MRKTKVSKTLILLAMVLAIALPTFGQWQGDTRISNTSAYSYIVYGSSGGSAIAADDQNVFITWYDGTSGSSGIRCMKFGIGSPPTPGPGDQVYSSNYYACVAAGDGTNAHIVWYMGSSPNYYSYMSVYNGTSWGSATSFSLAGHYYPSVWDDEAGNSYVTMTDRSMYDYPNTGYRVSYIGRSSSGTWGSTSWPMDESSPYRYTPYPDICTAPNGDIHVSYGIYRYTGTGNSYTFGHAWSTNGGSNWSKEDLGGDHSGYHTYPSGIVCDPNGTVYIAHQTYNSPYQIMVWRKTSGGSMEGPVNVSNSSNACYYPDIAADASGNIWVTWDENATGVYEVFYTRLPADADFNSGWETPLLVSDDDGEESRYSSIIGDQNGNVHVCWRDHRDYSSGNYEVYYDWYKGTGGGPPPPPDSLDLIMEQIVRPMTTEEPGKPFTPTCLIWQNLEDTTIEAKVSCRIKDFTTLQTVYEDVIGVYPLEPGYNEVSAFKSFSPQGNKEYEAFFVVEHPDDRNVSNNDKTKRFNTMPQIDVTPYAMIAPEDPQINSFSPEAYFAEGAGLQTPDVTLHCRITDVSYGAVVYEDSLTPQTFAANDTADAVFPQASDLTDGSYAIIFWATDAEGNDISHPPLEESFSYTGIAESPFGDFTLEAITPNPLTGSTKVSFSLPKASEVSLKVYDISGKVVTTLASGAYGAGSHSVNWDADVTPGVYFVRFITPEFSAVQKTLVIK